MHSQSACKEGCSASPREAGSGFELAESWKILGEASPDASLLPHVPGKKQFFWVPSVESRQDSIICTALGRRSPAGSRDVPQQRLLSPTSHQPLFRAS